MRKETRYRHIGYSFRLTARVLVYAPSHRQGSTYHSLYYTSHGALAGTRYSSLPWRYISPHRLKLLTKNYDNDNGNHGGHNNTNYTHHPAVLAAHFLFNVTCRLFELNRSSFKLLCKQTKQTNYYLLFVFLCA